MESKSVKLSFRDEQEQHEIDETVSSSQSDVDKKTISFDHDRITEKLFKLGWKSQKDKCSKQRISWLIIEQRAYRMNLNIYKFPLVRDERKKRIENHF